MKYKLLILPILLLLLTTGCTKEDLSVCTAPTSVTSVAFKCRFDFNNQNTDQFSELVNKVDLYIFDASGILLRHISETNPSFPKDYTITAPDIPQGTYSAVLYGTVSENKGVAIGAKRGDLNTTLIPMQEGESRKSDLRLMLNSVTGQTDKDLQVVLHGMVSQFTVTNQSQTHNVSFIRDTHVVELNISGLGYLTPETLAMPDVAVRIEGSNRAYMYDNTLDMELGKVIHAPYWQNYATNILVSRLSVLRLFKEHPMTLKIYNGNNVIWQLNLTAEIMKSPDYTTNEDLDREDKFVVRIVVTATGDLSITVNGWTTTTSSEIIG